MKTSSLFFAGLMAAVVAAPASAATLGGNLISYELTYPGMSTALQLLDPVSPQLITPNSFIHWSINGNLAYVSIGLWSEYHTVSISGPLGSSAVKTYAGFSQKFSSPNLAYDAVGRTISGTSSYNFGYNGSTPSGSGLGSYCFGTVSLCSGLYSEDQGRPVTFTYNITFGSTFDVFSGTVTVNNALANGGSILRTYNVSNVPLPMSGVLFGSTVLAMVGMRQRSKRN